MELCVVYGTRPEYLKVYPLLHKLDCRVIRILQHNDIVELDLKYDFLINVRNISENRLDSIGSEILLQLGEYIHQFTHILVQGDTSTAFYSALCAFQNRIKIIHLEAGMRTYDIFKPYPEECYRQMISTMTDIHLCPHIANKRYLEQENVHGDIHVVGNTILDLVKSYDLKISKGNRVLITFHRRENLQYLNDFINQLKYCMDENPEKEFVWFLHPNKELQTAVREYNLKCTFLNPCNHREFLEYVKDCYCVLTDSGGIQEECAFLGKPIIVLREYTERDQIQQPYLFLVKPPFDELKSVFHLLPDFDLNPCLVYGCGNSVELIKNILDNTNGK